MVQAVLNREEAVEGSKKNLNYFAILGIPDVFKFHFPNIFLAIWQLLTQAAMKDRGQEKLAIGLPRGFGKTLFLKLLVVWIILFTTRRFILVVCNTAPLAENFLADVQDILDSRSIKLIFGDWRIGEEMNRLDLKKFTFKGRAITLAAMGSGSSLRGLNIKLVRPDVILMDDMQSKEEAESVTDSNKQLSWMMGTLLKANDSQRCLFIFVGNMYTGEGAILRKLKRNSIWFSFVTGAILEDGESLWPELRSVEDLLEELQHDMEMGHPEIFYAEVMNDEEAGKRNTVDFSKINVWRNDTWQHEGGFVIIDPSAAKKKSDDVAIGAFKLFSGQPVCVEMRAGRFDPLQQIDNSLDMCMKHKLSVIVVEGVAYQSTLCFWMERRKQQLGLDGLKVREILPEGEAKNSRILTMFKQLTAQAGQLWITPEIRSAVLHQILYFDPMKTRNKDDILDVLAYAYRVIAKFGIDLLSVFEQLGEPIKAAHDEDLETAF